ncbi:HAD-IC family P-type ATPase, partial [Candidatus Berkelbacteria bacterium]|nr:HAD-IC family P-type ATPase [Candidatus Berkelbacteria bacterium]
PTEGALIVAAAKAGLNPTELASHSPRIDEIPFNSEHRLMITAHTSHKGISIAAKGSIEAIIKSSTSLLSGSKKIAFSQNKKDQILKEAHQVASQGFRVLAIASGNTRQKLSLQKIPGLTFLGFVAMLDAPRPEVATAIATAKKAGIRVKMITGDVAPTALAIASQLKLSQKNESVITAQAINKMSINDFRSAVKNNSVFAEIPPQLKLKIVEELQKEGEVVAVTGDGANDAPIIKRAQVGIAIGQGGADVSREVSDMVLADNNFATIVNAIGEGRAIFTNIQRVIWYLLATNVAEILVVAVSLFANLPLPLLPAQILWINVVTEGTGTIGLAVEPKRSDVLNGRPRPLKEPFINKLMLTRILLVGSMIALIVFLLFIYTYRRTNSLEYARSVAFTSLAILQIINLFNARSFTRSITTSSLTNNPVLVWSALASIFITVATVQTQAFQSIFSTTSVEILDWAIIAGASILVTITVEIHKLIGRKR